MKDFSHDTDHSTLGSMIEPLQEIETGVDYIIVYGIPRWDFLGTTSFVQDGSMDFELYADPFLCILFIDYLQPIEKGLK